MVRSTLTSGGSVAVVRPSSNPLRAWIVLVLVAFAVVHSGLAHAVAVLPPDAERGFGAAMDAINQKRELGRKVTLQKVAIDRSVARLTFHFESRSEPLVVELAAPGGSGHSVGKWFRLAGSDAPQLPAALAGLGKLLDDCFAKSPWVTPTPAGSPTNDGSPSAARELVGSLGDIGGRNLGAFWIALLVLTTSWGVYALRGRGDDQPEGEAGSSSAETREGPDAPAEKDEA